MSCDPQNALTLAINPDWLKAVQLAGVSLVLDNKEPFPDVMFEHSIAAAISKVEHELDLWLQPQRVEGERHDYRYANDRRYMRLGLDHGPVWSVDKMSIRYGNVTDVELPLEWVVLRNWANSEVELVPVGSTVRLPASLGVYHSGVFTFNLGASSQFFPSFFSFDYTAGFPAHCGEVVFTDAEIGAGPIVEDIVFDPAFFVARYGVYVQIRDAAGELVGGMLVSDTNKTRQGFRLTITQVTAPDAGVYTLSWAALTLPSSIIQLVGIQAALQALNIAGDIIIGPGIASKSTSVDGLSQNINTTSSATNAGYGARVRQYEREYKTLLSSIKSEWRRVDVDGF